MSTSHRIEGATPKDTAKNLTPEEGYLPGAIPDVAKVNQRWEPQQQIIDGVVAFEVKNNVTEHAIVTEIFRQDWPLPSTHVEQVFQLVLKPDGLTGWHLHRNCTDRLFVSSGHAKIVLYDARQTSRTFGVVNAFAFGSARPGLLVVPPGVWHGVRNISDGPTTVINVTDHAYEYDAPDHWRLPPDTDQIPYQL